VPLFFPALHWRRPLLEAAAVKWADKPVLGLAPLPSARRGEAEDRYLVSLDKPAATPGQPRLEQGELLAWLQLCKRQGAFGIGASWWMRTGHAPDRLRLARGTRTPSF